MSMGSAFFRHSRFEENVQIPNLSSVSVPRHLVLRKDTNRRMVWIINVSHGNILADAEWTLEWWSEPRIEGQHSAVFARYKSQPDVICSSICWPIARSLAADIFRRSRWWDGDKVYTVRIPGWSIISHWHASWKFMITRRIPPQKCSFHCCLLSAHIDYYTKVRQYCS